MDKNELRAPEFQEECRVYDLNEGKCASVKGYLFEFAEKHLKDMVSRGHAIGLAENAYYISQNVYGRAIVVCLYDEDHALQMIGDSQALGRMMSALERKFGESVKIVKMFKAKKDLDSMGIPQSQ